MMIRQDPTRSARHGARASRRVCSTSDTRMRSQLPDPRSRLHTLGSSAASALKLTETETSRIRLTRARPRASTTSTSRTCKRARGFSSRTRCCNSLRASACSSWSFTQTTSKSSSTTSHIRCWRWAPSTCLHRRQEKAKCVVIAAFPTAISRCRRTPRSDCNRTLSNVRREPAVSCRWTGWVREIIGWSSKISGNLPIILEESIEYTSYWWRNTGRCQHVTGWTWIARNLTGYAQILPRTLTPRSHLLATSTLNIVFSTLNIVLSVIWCFMSLW